MDLRFEYLDGTPEKVAKQEIKGLFVFSLYLTKETFRANGYYLENANMNANSLRNYIMEDPYIKGITMYANCILRESSIFKGWKVLLYTDAPTYASLREHNFLYGNPAIEFAIVTWPEYTIEENGHINGDIMRVMRFRAFFEFPTIPVFVRDADTIFSISSNNGYRSSRVLPDVQDKLYEWEQNYYVGAQAYPNKWIFGTSLEYSKHWHENKRRKRYAPVGAFAGLQSVMPKVDCFQTEDLWNEAIHYIREESVRKEEGGKITFSNEFTSGRIGKDERILLFFFFPRCLPKNIFFFELDLFRMRNFVLHNISVSNPYYPTAIFKRGSNVNLQSLFERAASDNFKTNTRPLAITIHNRNYQAKQSRKKNIVSHLLTIKNKNLELGNKSKDLNEDILFLGRTYFSDTVREIYNKLKEFDTDKSLEEIYNRFMALDTEYPDRKRNFVKELTYSETYDENLREKLPDIHKMAHMKDAILDEFVKRALSLKSLDEILNLVDSYKREKTRVLLTGVPPPPPPPKPDLLKGLFALMAAQKAAAPAAPPPKGGKGRKTRRKSKKV